MALKSALHPSLSQDCFERFGDEFLDTTISERSSWTRG
jgi:hypothetical protein